MSAVKEILAPAGGQEALYAAVKSGANAVYLGGQALNARRNAANFSQAQLQEAVAYCHAHNVKVYITLNTLVGDGEAETASKEIECACGLPADALILQDMGLVDLVRQMAPQMPLHASTQMSVQSAAGVKLLEKAGFSRVVLARELSLAEIRKIAEQTSAELEVFVHGALCMSVSGQCLLSAFLGGRSGNRGLCAQPCRLPFGVNDGKGNALSLKDLSAVEDLNALAEAGVTSFKIEGRMKRPEYVAAAVTACREGLAGKVSPELSKALRSVFSRSGFTKGYLEGKLGAEMFGTRQKEDVEQAAPVLKKLRLLYDKEKQTIPVDMALTCVGGEPLSLSARALGKTVFVQSDVCPEPALHRAPTSEELKDRISKCGGTPFYVQKAESDVEEGYTAPASAFNALRREVLEQLTAAIGTVPPVPCKKAEIIRTPHRAMPPLCHIRIFKAEQLPRDLRGVTRVLLPLTADKALIDRVHQSGAEAAAEIPRSFFGNLEKYTALLRQAKEKGADLAVASTLDGLHLALQSGLPVSAGFGTNVFNTRALEVLARYRVRDALVSCELTLNQISRLGGTLPRGVAVYGKIPLMLTRNCPVKTAISCAECQGHSHLTDRMGIRFPVQCSFGCSELLNSRPVYLLDRLGEVKNADYHLLRFTDESPAECERILECYRKGSAPQGEFTRGLYYRGVE